ncbi:MAG: M20/M25/M40 family metallo-hydrolase [Gammaproteobacteria bacterium]
MLHRRASALLLCLLSVTALASGLSPAERRIADAAERRQEAAIELLARAVDIDSPTEDLAGVRAVGDLFAAELRGIGMQVEWIDMPPEMKRAGHLVARSHGRHGKRVLMLGHLDTVLSGERFRREGQRGYGTGIDDMKGGLVVMLLALQSLHDAGMLADARVDVMLTGDEEDAGSPLSVSREPMLALARKGDVVLGFEAAYEGTITIGRRGAGAWTLETRGQTGHSSQIFSAEKGSAAVFEAARILEAFHAELSGERYLTINPSLIVGGTTARIDGFAGRAEGKNNVIPPVAQVLGDIRFISLEQEKATRERMQAIVARHHPGTSASIVFDESYPAMTPTPGNQKLLHALDAVSRELGQGGVEALDPSRRGAGDIGFVAHLLPGLDGLGSAGGANAHAAGEYTDLGSIVPMAQRTAVLLHRLTR